MSKDNLKDQIAQNMRLYVDLRFKQLTLLIAWIAIIGAGISHFDDKIIVSDFELKLLLAIASMLITAVLWIMEIRSTLYWVAHRNSFPDLWPKPENAKIKWINASNAVLILYISIYFFWFRCTLQWGKSPVEKIVGGVVGISLLILSVINYWPLWKQDQDI